MQSDSKDSKQIIATALFTILAQHHTCMCQYIALARLVCPWLDGSGSSALAPMHPGAEAPLDRAATVTFWWAVLADVQDTLTTSPCRLNRDLLFVNVQQVSLALSKLAD